MLIAADLVADHEGEGARFARSVEHVVHGIEFPLDILHGKGVFRLVVCDKGTGQHLVDRGDAEPSHL